jgi:ABC-type nitrate/sulfonate/bicarbonate transport system substrate-binding protein
MTRYVIMLLAAGLFSLPSGVHAAELREISIALSSTAFGASGLSIAKELGLFEKNGLNAKLTVMDSANSGVTALISGAAQGAQAGTGELIAARARGQRIVTISDLYRGYTGSLLLATSVAKNLNIAPDAPIAQRLKALDGLVIATPSATSGYTLTFRKAAESVGAKIRFTYMAQQAMGAALQTNAIQGMISAAPIWHQSVATGGGVLWINGPRGELPPGTVPVSSTSLLLSESTAQNDRELVRQLRQVITDLGSMITEHPDKVEVAVARLYPNLDPKVLKLVLATELQNLKTGPFTIADMKHEIEYVRSSGIDLPNLDRMDPASLLPGY